MQTQYLPRDWKLEHFGPGPWMDEPDHAQWIHHRTGMPCIAVRIPTGAWAGYVGVGPTHPLYRVSHAELRLCENVVVSNFGYGRWIANGTPVEVEVDVESSYWFYGFDYSHGDDLIPQHAMWRQMYRSEDVPIEVPIRSLGQGSLLESAYADFTFLRRCIERLAEQLDKPEQIARYPIDPDD
jgi:hypothetical protein